MAKITEHFVRSLRADGRRYWRNDDEIKGFCVRVNPTGTATYYFRYRVGGVQSSFKIADVAAMTAAQARERARKLAVDVADGKDPQDAKRAQRAVPLFKDFAQTYFGMIVKASKDQDEAKIRDVLTPRWGSRPINAIRTTDVRQLLVSLREKPLTPATVNRYRALIVTIFNRAIEHGAISTNPATPIKPLEENNKRDRHLSPSEVAAFFGALDSRPRNVANALRLLLLTGARKGNVLSMKWDDVNLDQRVWNIPRTKSGKALRVPLNESAVRVLRNQLQLKEHENPYVFPGNQRGTCLTTVHNIWKDLCAALGLQDFRVHDLRHTFASLVVQQTGDLPGLSKLMGHHSPTMTARYAHHADDHLRNATSKLDAVVGGALIG